MTEAVVRAVDHLVAAFERIAATRMAGLPMNNPALHVAAVGFRPWQDDYLVGVLVTPWAINLLLLGARASRDLYLAADCRRTWDFPSGPYEFMGGEEPECGPFQFCSLFSPAFEFADQGSAVATADAIMDALFVADSGFVETPAGSADLSRISPLQATTSRRGFLQGILGGPRAQRVSAGGSSAPR